MTFRLACGHAVEAQPSENWLDLMRRPCNGCLRAAIEARNAAEQPPLEPWIAAELRRGDGHLDGFSWRCDPPTDEGFRVAL